MRRRSYEPSFYTAKTGSRPPDHFLEFTCHALPPRITSQTHRKDPREYSNDREELLGQQQEQEQLVPAGPLGVPAVGQEVGEVAGMEHEVPHLADRLLAVAAQAGPVPAGRRPQRPPPPRLGRVCPPVPRAPVRSENAKTHTGPRGSGSASTRALQPPSCSTRR